MKIIVLLLILTTCAVVFLVSQLLEYIKANGDLNTVLTKTDELLKETKSLEMNIQQLSKEISEKCAVRDNIQKSIEALSWNENELKDKVLDLNHQVSLSELKISEARKMVGKELEIERERQIKSFTDSLEQEKQQLLASSDLTKYKAELQEINGQIEEARSTLKIQQEQILAAEKDADFKNFHSISISEQDEEDIKAIREFAPKLTRQEAFFKIIWTEFYQKPLQSLCKTLNAEKVTGVYKITNTENGRMYIGQATDIAARWKEHCKCSLGIGSTSYLTNKFYKALHDIKIENFTFEVIEICDKERLNDRESYWIDFYNATTFGYNTKAGG